MSIPPSLRIAGTTSDSARLTGRATTTVAREQARMVAVEKCMAEVLRREGWGRVESGKRKRGSRLEEVDQVVQLGNGQCKEPRICRLRVRGEEPDG